MTYQQMLLVLYQQTLIKKSKVEYGLLYSAYGLVIIILFLIVIISYHYTKHWSKQKNVLLR